ncbi:MAG: nuclear transport factor 2 family protein [Pseudomonadota bacterium]
MKSVSLRLFAAFVWVATSASSHADTPHNHAETVRAFMQAFNAHDAAAMTALVADDVQWLSIKGSTTTVELEGRSNLADAMKGYFAACTSCRSTIKRLMPSTERVSVLEQASWEGSNGPQSQQSMAVYEFTGSLIQRIYYFPEERQADTRDSASP